MKSYRYLLFDWDGTLAQTIDVILSAYKKTFAEYNLNPEDQEIIQKVLGTWDGPQKLGVKDLDGFTKKYLKRIKESYPTIQLYDGVEEVLQKCQKNGKKVALITTSNTETMNYALELFPLRNYFDHIFTSEDVKNHKPDPEIILKAMNTFHATPEETVIIGDSKSDLGAAQNAHIDSILFYPEQNKKYYPLEKLQKYHPTHIISDFKELLPIINI